MIASKLLTGTVLGAIAVALAQPAAAQEAETGVETDADIGTEMGTETGDAPPPVALDPATPEGRQVYLPADFARFAPRNALDMVQQVPGFLIRETDGGRGLGQATDNVVVNGARLASKTDTIRAQLARIPAASVIRIEIVDGASLDIPGLSGQVANVVARAETGLSGQFAWNPVVRAHYAEPSLFAGEVSVKGSSGPVAYTLALSNEPGRGAAGGPTLVFDGSEALIERRDTVLSIAEEHPKGSASLAFDGPGESLGNLSLTYRDNSLRLRDDEFRDLVTGVDRQRTFRARDDGYDYEISGDYEFGLGPGRLKLIGLERYDRSTYSESFVLDFVDGADAEGFRYDQQLSSGERIGRGEYRWNMGGADWQVALEGAFNRLDKEAGLFELAPDGEFVELPFPGGDGRVTEDRYEAIVSYGRPLTPHLTLQASAGGEYSNLSQTGSAEASRTFWRPKGSVNLAWAPEQGLDISLKIERKVGQLDFQDFLARAFIDVGNENAANADLVPQQSWETDLTAKKSLGVWGSTNFRLFDRRIEDLVGIVPLPGGVEGLGNIDSLHRYGFEWTSTVRFDPLGWKGAKLDTNVLVEESSLDDPLTGEPRQLDYLTTRLLELNLRHDVPATDWAWGASLFSVHGEPYYRLFEEGLQREGPVFLDLFVEHKDVFGLTVNALVGNVLGARRRVSRIVYTGLRDRAPIAFIEEADQLIGPIFKLSVKGSF